MTARTNQRAAIAASVILVALSVFAVCCVKPWQTHADPPREQCHGQRVTGTYYSNGWPYAVDLCIGPVRP